MHKTRIPQWKADIRWDNGDQTGEPLTDRTLSDDPAVAEFAFRRLLARADLIGQPCAARLVSPACKIAIYYSRFDQDIGAGRIAPDFPLDLSRTDRAGA